MNKYEIVNDKILRYFETKTSANERLLDYFCDVKYENCYLFRELENFSEMAEKMKK